MQRIKLGSLFITMNEPEREFADEFAALLICTEGQELEPGRWKLTSDQVEYGPHLQAAFEHLKWRGFADVTPLNDGLMVVFTKP